MNQLRANRAQRNALLIGATLFVALFVFVALPDKPWVPEGWSAPLTPPPAQAQVPSAGWNLKGWGWSSNIGWISFSCENTGGCSNSNYGVSIGSGGLMSGYAWSNNIGWISFQETSGFPSAPLQQARLERVGSELRLTGWARALAGAEASSAGWDGWIKLSSSGTEPDYGVTLLLEDGIYSLSGFAWGSSVMGWFKFGDDLNVGSICPGGVCVDPEDLAVSCTASPTPITGSGQVTWTAFAQGLLGTAQYQWFNDSTPLSGKTSPSYSETVTADATRQVRVTDSVTGISALSAPCSVDVIENPDLTITLNLVGGADAILTGAGQTLSANESKIVTLTPDTLVSLALSGIDTDETFTWRITPPSAGLCSGNNCSFNMPVQDTQVEVTVTKSAPEFVLECFTDRNMTIRCTDSTQVSITVFGDSASATSSPAIYFKSSGEGVLLNAELVSDLVDDRGNTILPAGSGTHEFVQGSVKGWNNFPVVPGQRVDYRFGLPISQATGIAKRLYNDAICVTPSQGGITGTQICLDLQYTSLLTCNGTQCPDL